MQDKPRKPNPFENPDPRLLITELSNLSPSHYVILNKYPIIPGHFLLVTKQFKPQTNLLEKNDLAAAYSILKSWSTEGSSVPSSPSASPPTSPPPASDGTRTPLFGFFNSGEHSGASQLHRHIQFVPVKGIRHSLAKKWQPLTDRLLPPNPASTNAQAGHPLDLPFAYFTASVSQDASPEELHQTYLSLYNQAKESIRAFTASNNGDTPTQENEGSEASDLSDSPAEICYNLALTTEGMVICPRLSGGATVEIESGNVDAGFDRLQHKHSVVWEFNGSVLAGTLLVKSKVEFDALLESPDLMSKALGAIGVPGALMSKL